MGYDVSNPYEPVEIIEYNTGSQYEAIVLNDPANIIFTQADDTV